MKTVDVAGLALSVIGFGGYELGPERGQTADLDSAVQTLDAASQAGVNWVDTSEVYHDRANEALIGAALRRTAYPLAVASKVAPDADPEDAASGLRPEQIRTACEGSLLRLRRDYLDVYFLHWPDPRVPLEDTWGAMAALQDAGMVRAIGMSNYDLDAVAQCHQQRRVDVVQIGLSLIDRLRNRAYAASCRDLGIAVTIYEPLAGGLLTGVPLADLRARWADWQEAGFYQRLLAGTNGERSIAVAEGLRAIAAQLEATIAQVAIAWVLQQAGVGAAIVGSRNPDHVNANAGAVDLNLSDVEAQIEALLPLGPAYT